MALHRHRLFLPPPSGRLPPPWHLKKAPRPHLISLHPTPPSFPPLSHRSSPPACVFIPAALPPSPGRFTTAPSSVRAPSAPPRPLSLLRPSRQPPASHSACAPHSGRHATALSAAQPWSIVDRVHVFFLTKIILKSIIPDSFAKKPLGFSKINPQSLISQLGPWNLKNNSSKVLSLRKIHKNRRNFEIPYLFNHYKSSDSCAKIFRITSSLILCIHLTHVCCILLIDYLCLFYVR
jgi:hypothetical protein